MKQKLLTILLSMIMVFSTSIYAKETEKEPIPGRAIFVMAPDYPIHVQSRSMTSHDHHLHVNMKVPQLKGLRSKAFEKQLNKQLQEDARNSKEELGAKASAHAKQAKSLGIAVKDYELIRNFRIKPSIEPYLVIGVFEYRYTGGNHGMAQQKYVVIDKALQKIITLPELFKADTDYESILTQEIIKQLPYKKSTGVVFVKNREGINTIDEDQTFYVNEKGDIVLVFNIYEVTSYGSGTIEFVIPKENIKNSLVSEK